MSGPFTKITAAFKRTSLREKLLVFAFVVVLLFIWGKNLAGRASEWKDERQLVAVELDTQQQFLDREEFFSEGVAAALGRVDPSKTFAASQLSGEVDRIVRQIGLDKRTDIYKVRTQSGEIFNDHNLEFKVSRVSISDFISLNQLLQGKTPYISLRSVSVKKSRTNPEQLDVTYLINSFDLKDSIL